MIPIRQLFILKFVISFVFGMSFEMRRLAISSNQLGFDILRALQNDNSSLVICPFCLSTQLAIITTGLDPNDKLYSSFRSLLYIQQMSPIDAQIAYGSLQQHINDLDEYHSINRIFVQRSLPINYHYYLILQRDFKTVVQSLDIDRSPRESVEEINSVFSSIFPVDNIQNFTTILQDKHFLLLSGVSFQASLAMEFENSRKKRGIFSRIREKIYQKRLKAFQQQYLMPMRPLSSENIKVIINTPKPEVDSLITSEVYLESEKQSLNQSFKPEDIPKLTTEESEATTKTEFEVTTFENTTKVPVISTEITTATQRMRPIPRPTKNPFSSLEEISEIENLFTKQETIVRLTHSSYLQATLMEIPFTDGFLSLNIFIPDNGLDEIIARLNMQVFRDTQQQLQVRTVNLMMPELLIETSLPNWNVLLQTLGLIPKHSDLHYFGGIENFPLWNRLQLEQLTRINITNTSYQMRKHVLHAPTDDKLSYQNEQNDQNNQMSTFDLTNKEFIFLVLEPISGLILVAGKTSMSHL